jgi:hypothetical protein
LYTHSHPRMSPHSNFQPRAKRDILLLRKFATRTTQLATRITRHHPKGPLHKNKTAP